MAFVFLRFAGRLMSFSAAALELCVTQAAVSRRIKALENDLGFEPFLRSGRHLSFTEKGAHLYARAGNAFDLLSSTLDALAPNAIRGPISIAAGHSLSHLWLSPVLNDFTARFPDVPVQVLSTDCLDEIDDTQNDLAIIYGAETHPGWKLTPLVSETLVPVATPQFLRREGLDPAQVDLSPHEILLHRHCDYHLANAAWINLQSWFNWAVPDRVRITPTVTYSTYMLTLHAVLDHGGIMLGSRSLMADYLNRGSLIEVTSRAWDTGKAYCLGTPKHTRRSADALRLYQYLLERRVL